MTTKKATKSVPSTMQCPHPIFGPVEKLDVNANRVVPQRKSSYPVLAISKCPTKPREGFATSPPTSPQYSSSFSSSSSSSSASSYSSPSPKLPANFKSVICHFWQQTGKCSNGASCNFAHGIDEKREWDRRLRKGKGIGGSGDVPAFEDDADGDDDARVQRVKKTFRNDGQFSSQAFGKDKRDIRKGGRKLSNLSSK